MLATRVRAERQHRQWTLAELGQRSGLSASTLSKVERGQMTLSYGNVLRLARAFEIDVSTLFADAPQEWSRGKRSVTRRTGGRRCSITGCRMRLLASDLLQKRLVPMVMTVTARTLEEAGGLKYHEGEEVYYVVSGSAELLTDLYEPLRLDAGDGVYMDGDAGHAFISLGEEDAVIFAVNEGYPVYSAETGELELTLNEPATAPQRVAGRRERRQPLDRRVAPVAGKEHEEPSTVRRIIKSPQVGASKRPFSNAVRAGNTVYISGQLPIDVEGNTVGAGNVRTQTRQALINVQATLAAAGASLDDVVKTTVYLVNMADHDAMNEVYREFFADEFPARTTVTTPTLAPAVQGEGYPFLIEIDAVAVILSRGHAPSN